MKIGIVSNSKICMPLVSYLGDYNKAGVILYLGKSRRPDVSANEILALCRTKGIAVHTESNAAEIYQWQQLHTPDIIFFSGYSYKVDVEQLSGVPKGIFNIHFGKLPQYKGPSPVFWQLKNGERSIGLAIHEMTNTLDSGPIVWEQNINNEEYHTYNYINQIFSELQVGGVLSIIEKIATKQITDKISQNATEANYYKRPQLADVMINWDKMEAKVILDLIKACNSWNNGAITLINGYELKILDAEKGANKLTKETPGKITIREHGFSVACINDEVLNINFFNMNNTYIPARHAGFYGLKTGQIFISKI
ncbi:formyltransferase family protein [Mucilaginibacter flavus]|uniref:formyltransferase family protein n=1 Tax=Mucilaginibacter flavus TaxID=931504 RepID=UPI0025B5B2A4|nr:formyltransferase family protein [Mucilaginibacter flavus]MDN3582454.1 formyltransferase family protein [Mucilaginibacter flavus]